MVSFILFILVCVLIGLVLHLYNRVTLLENALSMLQYDKGVDAIGHVEGYR